MKLKVPKIHVAAFFIFVVYTFFQIYLKVKHHIQGEVSYHMSLVDSNCNKKTQAAQVSR